MDSNHWLQMGAAFVGGYIGARVRVRDLIRAVADLGARVLRLEQRDKSKVA